MLRPEQIEALLPAALGKPVARSVLYKLSASSGGTVLCLRELVLGALTAGNLALDGDLASGRGPAAWHRAAH